MPPICLDEQFETVTTLVHYWYHPIVNRNPPLKDQIRGSVISGHFLRIGKCRGSVINTQKISGIPGGQLLTLKISGNLGP